MSPIEEAEDRGSMNRHVHHRLGVLLGVSQAHHLMPRHLGCKGFDWAETGVFVRDPGILSPHDSTTVWSRECAFSWRLAFHGSAIPLRDVGEADLPWLDTRHSFGSS